MSKPKHTPGPWIIGTRQDGSRCFSLGDPIKGPHYQGDIHCSDADARLIAAAPDLLEALKSMDGHIMDLAFYIDSENHQAAHGELDAIRLIQEAAIKKAEEQG